MQQLIQLPSSTVSYALLLAPLQIERDYRGERWDTFPRIPSADTVPTSLSMAAGPVTLATVLLCLSSIQCSFLSHKNTCVCLSYCLNTDMLVVCMPLPVYCIVLIHKKLNSVSVSG